MVAVGSVGGIAAAPWLAGFNRNRPLAISCTTSTIRWRTAERKHGDTIAQAASFLCRDEDEVREKMKELGLHAPRGVL